MNREIVFRKSDKTSTARSRNILSPAERGRICARGTCKAMISSYLEKSGKHTGVPLQTSPAASHKKKYITEIPLPDRLGSVYIDRHYIDLPLVRTDICFLANQVAENLRRPAVVVIEQPLK